jgi:hypothetical protein
LPPVAGFWGLRFVAKGIARVPPFRVVKAIGRRPDSERVPTQGGKVTGWCLSSDAITSSAGTGLSERLAERHSQRRQRAQRPSLSTGSVVDAAASNHRGGAAQEARSCAAGCLLREVPSCEAQQELRA